MKKTELNAPWEGQDSGNRKIPLIIPSETRLCTL